MIASMINEFVKKNLPNSSPNLNSLVQKRSSKNFFLTVFRIRKKSECKMVNSLCSKIYRIHCLGNCHMYVIFVILLNIHVIGVDVGKLKLVWG